MLLETGLINFPIEQHGIWDDTGEGLTVVCLAVLSEKNQDLWDEFPLTLIYPEGELMGDNLLGSPSGVPITKYKYEEAVLMSSEEDIATVKFNCLIPMGVIKWTGFDYMLKRYWYCSFDDLKEEGKAFYRTIEDLYIKPVRLLTFIKVQYGSKKSETEKGIESIKREST
jgi:hypothetical protein